MGRESPGLSCFDEFLEGGVPLQVSDGLDCHCLHRVKSSGNLLPYLIDPRPEARVDAGVQLVATSSSCASAVHDLQITMAVVQNRDNR